MVGMSTPHGRADGPTEADDDRAEAIAEARNAYAGDYVADYAADRDFAIGMGWQSGW